MDFEKPYLFGSAVSIDVVFYHIFTSQSYCAQLFGENPVISKNSAKTPLSLYALPVDVTLERTAFVKRKADRIYLTF